MAAPKFNFVPEKQLRTKASSNVILYTTSIYNNGQMIFEKDYIHVYELEGKYVKMFADTEKKCIGWSVIEGDTNLDELGDSRQLSADTKGGFRLAVGRLLGAMGYDYKNEKSIIGLEIKTYKSSLHSGDIFYVQLPPKEVVVTLNGETQSTNSN